MASPVLTNPDVSLTSAERRDLLEQDYLLFLLQAFTDEVNSLVDEVASEPLPMSEEHLTAAIGQTVSYVNVLQTWYTVLDKFKAYIDDSLADTPQPIPVFMPQQADFVPDYLYRQMREVMENGIDAGQDKETIIGQIRSTLLPHKMDYLDEEGWPDQQAWWGAIETIGRTAATEHHNAKIFSEIELDGSGMKRWVSMDDARVRDSHIDIDGEEVDVRSYFSNGLMFPGDTSGPAEEWVNCRCVIEDAESGKGHPALADDPGPIDPDTFPWDETVGVTWHDANFEDYELEWFSKDVVSPALDHYTGTGYHEFRKYLVQGSRASGIDIEKYVEEMDFNFLHSGLQTQYDYTLWRGEMERKALGETPYDPDEMYQVGQYVTQPGFLSTSTDRHVAESFAGRQWLIEVRVPQGTTVVPGLDSEKELILNRNSVFRVLEKTYDDPGYSGLGRIVLELEED